MIGELLKQHYNLDNIQLKDKLIQGGGGSIYFDYVNMILGLTLITIGFISFFYDRYWKELDAKIISRQMNKFENKIKIEYQVGTNTFNKIISFPYNQNFGSSIKIFYDKNDPNIIKTSLFNHRLIGGLLILIGLYLITIKYIN